MPWISPSVLVCRLAACAAPARARRCWADRRATPSSPSSPEPDLRRLRRRRRRVAPSPPRARRRRRRRRRSRRRIVGRRLVVGLVAESPSSASSPFCSPRPRPRPRRPRRRRRAAGRSPWSSSASVAPSSLVVVVVVVVVVVGVVARPEPAAAQRTAAGSRPAAAASRASAGLRSRSHQPPDVGRRHRRRRALRARRSASSLCRTVDCALRRRWPSTVGRAHRATPTCCVVPSTRASEWTLSRLGWLLRRAGSLLIGLGYGHRRPRILLKPPGASCRRGHARASAMGPGQLLPSLLWSRSERLMAGTSRCLAE